MSIYSPSEISEKQFFRDLEKAKEIVDNGITDYFILANPKSMENVKSIGNTTLKDCVDVFGLDYVLFFRFAGFFNSGNNGATKDEYQSFRIRPVTKSDRAKLRDALRYTPDDTWICDWRDGKGFGLLLPFIQNNDTGKIKWLLREPEFVRKPVLNDGLTAPEFYMKNFIESLPDYFDLNLAIVRYKDVDMAIPIARGTAKNTFKHRERDASGVKRHIVHAVRDYERRDTGKKVERHLRGSSEIEINGVKVTIMSPLEFSDEIHMRKMLLRRKRGAT